MTDPRPDPSLSAELGVLASEHRLEALARSRLLDSPAEEPFDRATRVASLHFGVPVALVSIVDDHRQFFKSIVGLPEPWASERETPLSHSFCQYVVAGDAPLVVTDARTHTVLRDNLAIESLDVIAYCGVPLRDGEGNVLGSLCVIDGHPKIWTDADVGMLVDLAAMLRAELRLGEALRLADEREAARSQMLSALSHDLRGPLAAVRGLATTALRHAERLTAEEVAVMLQAIERQAQQSGELVDRILTLEGRPPRPQPQQVELRAEVAALVADRALVTPEHDVRMVAGRPVDVCVDVGMVRQILGNVLDNAAKYAEKAVVQVAVRPLGDGVELVIADDGPGMDPGAVASAFDRFTGADAAGSHGLGLHIVQRLAMAMGGDVALSSQLGNGTTVRVGIPNAVPVAVA